MSDGNAKRDWSKVQRRSKGQLNIRLNDAEEAELKERAQRANASLAGYVKAAALNLPLPRRSSRSLKGDEVAIRQMLAQLGRLTANANMIAKANNGMAKMMQRGDLPDVGEMRQHIIQGEKTLAEINGQLAGMKAQIFDALNLK